MNTRRHALLSAWILALFLAVPSDLQAQVPRGIQVRLNRNTAGYQIVPAVATAPGRGFVAAWQEGSSASGPWQIKFRLFSAAGAPRTPEILAGTGSLPALAMAVDGRFVVVWESLSNQKSIVVGRRFAADGKPLAAQFPLALAASNGHQQHEPAVAMAPDGRFVAVWSQGDSEPYNYETFDVYARRFAADGKPLGAETPAIALIEEQSAPRVALAADGGFVVVCQSYGGEPTFYDVFARLFAADGSPLADAFQVNADPETEATSQLSPAVARAAAGRFLVAWADRAGDPNTTPPYLDGTGVRARLYAADGTPQGPEFRVNAFTRGQQEAPAAASGNGTFLLAWQSGGDQDGDKEGIFARVYGLDGTPFGREFRINLGRAGSQIGPAIALAKDGRGVAAWNTPDGDIYGVDARLLGPSGGN